MKKLTLLTLSTLFLVSLVGCGKNITYEKREIQATVVSCDQGSYNTNSLYSSLANMYLSQKDYGAWSMYNSLAYSNGTYVYNITVEISNKNYTIVRPKPYKAGQSITVTEVTKYKDSKIPKKYYE